MTYKYIFLLFSTSNPETNTLFAMIREPNLFIVFQALLRAALPQQSAMILVFMAVDRYTCMLHPDKYHKHSSKKVSITTHTSKLLCYTFQLLTLLLICQGHGAINFNDCVILIFFFQTKIKYSYSYKIYCIGYEF